MEKTNALRMLDRLHADYRVFTYDGGALSGVEIARAMGQPVDCVFKTLVTVAKSGAHYVFMVPVAEELDLKKAAVTVGEKALSMIPQKELLPLTGYIHGGCSPLGMKKVFPTIIHKSADAQDTIRFSAGRVGLQVETSPAVLRQAIRLKSADIIVEKETLL